jgi:hypothetical protein
LVWSLSIGEKSLAPAGDQTLVVQSVVYRYTDFPYHYVTKMLLNTASKYSARMQFAHSRESLEGLERLEVLDSSVDNGIRHSNKSIIRESQDGRCGFVT